MRSRATSLASRALAAVVKPERRSIQPSMALRSYIPVVGSAAGKTSTLQLRQFGGEFRRCGGADVVPPWQVGRPAARPGT